MKRIVYVILFVLLLASFTLATGCSEESEATSAPADKEKASFEGETLNLYVAAGMKNAMDRVIATFQEETGATVAVNYGPSGGLYAQIEQNQPCDLYFSADWLYIEKIEEIGKLEKSNKFLTDNLVLVVSETGQSKIASLEDLSKPDVVMVMADPQAPVGVYSKNSLVNMGLWEKVSQNIKAMPSTVNQVAIMVKEDQADAGIVYSSVANGNELEIVEVIDSKYSGEIIFGTAIIKEGNTELAEAFATHAINNVAVFEEYGWKIYE